MAAESCTRPRLSRCRSSFSRSSSPTPGWASPVICAMSASSQSEEGPKATSDVPGALLLVIAAAACIRASHAATGLRRTLPVEVRGRSGSGHNTQRLMRWKSASVALARSIAAATLHPDPRQASTAHGSGPVGVSMATTAQAAISGCSSMAASMSSGWMLSPDEVTITSLLRPKNRSSPDSCRSAMSPVANHSSWRGRSSPPCQVGAGDHGAAHEHLAVGGELDFAPGERLADGALGHVEGMVERDERGGLGHAVALDQHESERVPELFERPRQRAAAGDESPELEAELAMHAGNATSGARSSDFASERRVRQVWDGPLPDGP